MLNPELIFYPFTMAMKALIWIISQILGVIAYLFGYSLRLTFHALRALYRLLKSKFAKPSEFPEVQRSVQD